MHRMRSCGRGGALKKGAAGASSLYMRGSVAAEHRPFSLTMTDGAASI